TAERACAINNKDFPLRLRFQRGADELVVIETFYGPNPAGENATRAVLPKLRLAGFAAVSEGVVQISC
ncbi:MAG TPA: hypothetical protein VFF42_09860, partial [Candidatus Eremiobacteraceae bacterium]|nr:hypothetical protein [Candidatus Eremiobacteraceae bacterium]